MCIYSISKTNILTYNVLKNKIWVSGVDIGKTCFTEEEIVLDYVHFVKQSYSK